MCPFYRTPNIDFTDIVYFNRTYFDVRNRAKATTQLFILSISWRLGNRRSRYTRSHRTGRKRTHTRRRRSVGSTHTTPTRPIKRRPVHRVVATAASVYSTAAPTTTTRRREPGDIFYARTQRRCAAASRTGPRSTDKHRQGRSHQYFKRTRTATVTVVAATVAAAVEATTTTPRRR